MYTFAWTITLSDNKKINLDIDYIEVLKKWKHKVIYLMWETNVKSVEELVDTLKEELWNIDSYEISFSKEQKVQVMSEIFDDWVYEVACFEWEEVEFKEIRERFVDTPEVVSVREAEFSDIFKNRKIKVDFLY